MASFAQNGEAQMDAELQAALAIARLCDSQAFVSEVVSAVGLVPLICLAVQTDFEVS